MQTDIFLQKALVEEVKDILKGYTTLNNNDFADFNVYPQSLPAKEGRKDSDHFPYVLVCIDEEVVENADSERVCSVYFLVGIQDNNPNKQGHFDVLNVLNKLEERFLKRPLLNCQYRINFPITKKVQEEDTWPKFIGGMATLWSVNKPMIEETEYD